MKTNENNLMTIGELIEKLKELPYDVPVFLFQIINESDGKAEFVPLLDDFTLSRRNTLELYPVFDSDLAYR